MKAVRRLGIGFWLFLGMLVLVGTAVAQPCCSISEIDAESGLITVVRSADRETFQFLLGPAQAQALQVGQGVELDEQGNLLAIHALQPLAPYTGGAVDPTRSAIPPIIRNLDTKPEEPCCNIAAIDTATNVISVVRNADGERFEFQLDEETLAGLSVGQAVELDEAGNLVGFGDSRAQGAGATDRAAGEPALPEVRTPDVTPGGPCCNITPKAGLTARLGSLVVVPPEGVELNYDHIQVFRAGEETGIHDAYGTMDFAVPPGMYDVSINGQLVRNVEVRGGHETRVRVGVLIAGVPGNHLQIFGAEPVDGADRALVDLYDTGAILLPVGDYRVSIAGQFVPITVPEGQVTEF